MKKLDIGYISKKLEDEGYSLLSTKYDNCRQKLDYICSNNHRHSVSWNGWRKGDRCPYCSGLNKPSIKLIKQSMCLEGYKLLSSEYVNAKTKLKVKCNNDHVFYTTWSNWNNKTRPRRCPYCSKRPPLNINYVSNDVVDKGYKLLSKTYINAKHKMHLICPNGHDYFVSWDNWNSKGNRCPICNGKGVSKAEIDLANILRSNYNEFIINNARKIIPPYELDIVIPDKKIAIEYCGLYWHPELAGKDSKYHLNKLEMCNKKGYRLITIFEDEWILNKSILLPMLLNKLGIGHVSKIYARNCKIKEINIKDARKFCESNHIQGYTGSNIKLGLFYKDVLFSVMTFAKPSISKGRKDKSDNIWELSRFCSKTNYVIVGGASKLLKYFERNYHWQEIFSYADRRWSDGNLYRKIGFDFDGYTRPSYWYFSEKEYPRRRHRFTLRKLPSDVTSMSEWDNRIIDGWNRIWDCGNYKFTKKASKGV